MNDKCLNTYIWQFQQYYASTYSLSEEEKEKRENFNIKSKLHAILEMNDNKHKNINITLHLAEAFIQSDLQLIRLSRRHTPLEQCGVKGLAQGPNSCSDLILATPGIESLTLQVQVH